MTPYLPPPDRELWLSLLHPDGMQCGPKLLVVAVTALLTDSGRGGWSFYGGVGGSRGGSCRQTLVQLQHLLPVMSMTILTL